MSAYALFITYAYMVIPAVSAIALLGVLTLVVWACRGRRGGLNPFGWVAAAVMAVLVFGNAWVFVQVLGIFLQRSVLI